MRKIAESTVRRLSLYLRFLEQSQARGATTISSADLARRGCTYLQLDEVPLALVCDPKNQEIVRRRGEDPQTLIDSYINVINDCVKERPRDMVVAVHLCRGNVGHGMASGGYEPIAEQMFGTLDVDGYFLEYDTPRAGDFSPLRHLPKGKTAVLGLVTTKLPLTETDWPDRSLGASLGYEAELATTWRGGVSTSACS